jgi:hypothetical protein
LKQNQQALLPERALLKARQEKFRDAFDIAIDDMKDIEFANKLAKLACYRWFNQNLKEVYTQFCICLLNANMFDQARILLQDEY